MTTSITFSYMQGKSWLGSNVRYSAIIRPLTGATVHKDPAVNS